MTRDKKISKTKNHSSKPTFAKRSLGQNFLVDNNYIEKIITALSLTPEDTVIEIGPGRGALTERLLEQAGSVIAVEIDDELSRLLEEEFSGRQNFSLVHEDVLEVDFATLAFSSTSDGAEVGFDPVKVAANLPYNISTKILQALMDQRKYFSRLVLMLQREVVERITAEPGNSERGFFTVLVEAYMQAEKLFDVPPEAFRPRPKVWSSVVELTPKENDDADIWDEKLFRALISAGFAYKRKTILNNFKNAPPDLRAKTGDAQAFLTGCEIDPVRRAETLTLAEWKRLNDALSRGV